ncbi:hypothetical protein CEXT_366141 [Caerostris extrusa]|uniref:Uncharacterized protein n=1 Tax=Caerostris extrusa TaxID=172846 RepID=A0AAV4UEJ2_CAEEX|nr:hypothetical protein CEXT_366141 [Caerostris extrusa]
MLKGFNFGPGAMETAEDEWWVRMERVLRRSTTPFGKHQERVIQNLWIQRVRQYPRSCWPRLHFPKSNPILSDEEHCARVTTVIKKKDIAQNLYDAYAAALTGYSIDDDDLKQLKKRHDDLQLAMRGEFQMRFQFHLTEKASRKKGFSSALRKNFSRKQPKQRKTMPSEKQNDIFPVAFIHVREIN